MKRSFLVSALISLVFVLGLIIRITPPKKEKLANVACQTSSFSGIFDTTARLAVYQGEEFLVNNLALNSDDRTAVLSAATDERWVEVDLSEQKLYAWEGDKLFLETPVSTGLPWTPTPEGEFYIWIKLRATKMEGGEGAYYYNLPNVPYVMFFGNKDVPNYRGYGLHGTYWHNSFGTPRSHGCVNLPTEIAKELYYWTGPYLSEGKSVVYSSEENTGTRVIIHQ